MKSEMFLRINHYFPLALYALGILAFMLIGTGVLALRLKMTRAKAAKKQKMGSGLLLPALLWSLGAVGDLRP